MAIERRRVFYSGRVQGVGFRATCRELAERRSVTGSVRNLPDGRVELLAEGQPAEVEIFLTMIRAEMGDWVRSETSQTEPAGDPPLSDFSIEF